TVGLEGRNREGLDEIVNAVVESYLEKQKKEEFYEVDKRIESLQEERKKAIQEINEKSDQKTAISREIGVTSFGEGFLNPYDTLLIKANEALNAARRQRIDAEAQLNSYTQTQKTGDKSAVDAFAQQMVDADAGITSLKANLNIRRSQLMAK